MRRLQGGKLARITQKKNSWEPAVSDDPGEYILPSNSYCQEFPGGPVVRTTTLIAEVMGSIPGWGTKILNVCDQRKTNKKVLFSALTLTYFFFNLFVYLFGCIWS